MTLEKVCTGAGIGFFAVIAVALIAFASRVAWLATRDVLIFIRNARHSGIHHEWWRWVFGLPLDFIRQLWEQGQAVLGGYKIDYVDTSRHRPNNRI